MRLLSVSWEIRQQPSEGSSLGALQLSNNNRVCDCLRCHIKKSKRSGKDLKRQLRTWQVVLCFHWTKCWRGIVPRAGCIKNDFVCPWVEFHSANLRAGSMSMAEGEAGEPSLLSAAGLGGTPSAFMLPGKGSLLWAFVTSPSMQADLTPVLLWLFVLEWCFQSRGDCEVIVVLK